MILKVKLMNKRPKIFISYSSKDEDFVQRLADGLKEQGIDVWFAKEKIKVGDSITGKISQGLEECNFFAVVLSKNSVGSDWIKKELDSAMMKELEKKEVRVYPILTEYPP